MMAQIATRCIALFLALGLVACGVKTDLQPPPGAIQQKGQADPSKPPKPLGQ